MARNGVEVSSNRPRHILTLTAEEKNNFLNSFDTIFSDIDGVVWHLNDEIDGGPEGFQKLKQTGKKVVFISNNSLRPEESCLKRFKNANLDVAKDEHVQPVKSVIAYLKMHKFEGLLYVIGSKNCKHELKTAGFRIIDGPEYMIEENLIELESIVYGKEPVRCVVIDADLNCSYSKLMRAERFARDPECLLLAGITDDIIALQLDKIILGPGYFYKILETATRRKAIVLGKPGHGLSELLLQQYGINEPKRALMIGDTLNQDIGFGHQCGFQTLAVLSGTTSYAQMMNEKKPEFIPNFYADSMADFIQFFRDI